MWFIRHSFLAHLFIKITVSFEVKSFLIFIISSLIIANTNFHLTDDFDYINYNPNIYFVN